MMKLIRALVDLVLGGDALLDTLTAAVSARSRRGP